MAETTVMKTTDAPKVTTEQAKEKLAANQKAQEAAREKDVADPSGSKPTPTQEENDRFALGEHVVEHEPDGSPVEGQAPDPQHKTTKQQEAQKPSGSGYQTRQHEPTRSTTHKSE
jgi:hypothetical protein